MALKIFGVVFIVMGVLMVLKTDWFLRAIGTIPWAERVIGSTRSFFKILGVILIFVGLTMFFNMFGGIVYWVLGPLVPNR